MATNDFFHGVQGFIVRDGARPVTAVRSSVVGVVVMAGKGPVNTPVILFGNETQGNNIFGPFLDDGFTAGMVFKHGFAQLGTLVVAINVCDPEVHKTTVASEVVVLSTSNNKGRTAKRYHTGETTVGAVISAPFTLDSLHKVSLPNGATITGVKNSKGGAAYVLTTDYTTATAGGVITLTMTNAAFIASGQKTLWITYTLAAAPVVDVDYTLDKDTGEFKRIITSAKIVPGSELTVGYDFVDASKVTASDVIGATATVDDKATGIYALRAAPTTPGVLIKPKLLIAPKWSHLIGVANALDSAAAVLGGRAFVDSDNTTYGSAVDYATAFAGELNRVSVLYPNPTVSHPVTPNDNIEIPASIIAAFCQARVDKQDGQGDPYVSLSNKSVVGLTGLTRQVSHSVVNLGEGAGESEQQWLNANHVMTIINEQGWRMYGNTQANGEFLCVQRMADYVLESAVHALVWAIDKNINGPALLDQMLTVIRMFLRSLEARGALVANPDPDTDNDVWFPEELNTPDQISAGHAYLNFRMNPPPPLQRLTVTGVLTHEFVKRLFQLAQA